MKTIMKKKKKTIMKYNFTATRMAKIKKDVEKLELSYTDIRNIKWYSLFGESLAVPQMIKYRAI